MRQAVPGVKFGVSFTDQLYADDLVVTTECQHDLQIALVVAISLPSSCPFCDAPHGDMFHYRSECAAFSDLREQWCR